MTNHIVILGGAPNSWRRGEVVEPTPVQSGSPASFNTAIIRSSRAGSR